MKLCFQEFLWRKKSAAVMATQRIAVVRKFNLFLLNLGTTCVKGNTDMILEFLY